MQTVNANITSSESNSIEEVVDPARNNELVSNDVINSNCCCSCDKEFWIVFKCCKVGFVFLLLSQGNSWGVGVA